MKPKIKKKKVQRLLTQIGKKCYPLVEEMPTTTATELIPIYKNYALEELKQLKEMGVNYDYLSSNGFMLACVCGIPLAIKTC